MGDILNDARADAAMILTSGGFETSIKFIKPNLDELIVEGLAIRRTDTMEYGDETPDTLTPFSSVTVALAPFNFTDTYITFKGWKVEFTDAQKTLVYKLGESLPNRTLGIVNILLKDGEN